MFKQKLMNIFKGMFGGVFTKENGKVFWSKDGFKELASTGFLKHFIDNKKDPSSNVSSTVVSKVVSTEVNTIKPPAPKKVKKNAKVPTNPEVSEGS